MCVGRHGPRGLCGSRLKRGKSKENKKETTSKGTRDIVSVVVVSTKEPKRESDKKVKVELTPVVVIFSSTTSRGGLFGAKMVDRGRGNGQSGE
jgi:hypothetical protein